MEPAGLALAVVGTVDLCLRYGKLLLAKYQDYKHAEQDVYEMIISIEGSWLKTQIQLGYVSDIWDRLDQRLQTHYGHIFQVLQDKLQAALAKVDSVLILKDGEAYTSVSHRNRLPVIKTKAAFLKPSIQQAIQDLEDWQSKFDPSWYLMTLVADSTIDQRLQQRSNVYNDPTEKLKAIREAMRPANARQMQQSIIIDGRLIGGVRQRLSRNTTYVSHPGNEQAVLLDTITYPGGTDLSLATTHVRDLARVLSNADPNVFALLACHGVVKVAEQAGDFQFQFVFVIPQGLYNPITLRDLLLQGATYPLDQRFQLAKELARSITFVHTYGFVHKNIRPETIVVFQDHSSVLIHSFLVGFERFRPAAAGSFLRGDPRWETNLYRHPRRHGSLPEDRYIMQHDIYSLGVCLLELGLCSSFVYPSSKSVVPEPGPELIKAGVVVGEDPFATQQKLISMASDRLPGLMGPKYTNIVISCLRCLDSEETNLFGTADELKDQDGVVIGVRYIEKILMVIEEISV